MPVRSVPCLRLRRLECPLYCADSVRVFSRSEDTSDWLLTDKTSSWPGTPADQGWRYLRQSLERHDGHQTDYAYTKVVFETILSLDRRAAPPPWLIHILEVG